MSPRVHLRLDMAFGHAIFLAIALLPIDPSLAQDAIQPGEAYVTRFSGTQSGPGGAVIDTNGYLPVHNKIYSHPQRPGDVTWNTANSRNRRIFNDAAGLAAGRNQRAYLVQSYARDMGNGKTIMMREIDVPVRVQGRHWGGFRTAYKL